MAINQDGRANALKLANELEIGQRVWAAYRNNDGSFILFPMPVQNIDQPEVLSEKTVHQLKDAAANKDAVDIILECLGDLRSINVL